MHSTRFVGRLRSSWLGRSSTDGVVGLRPTPVSVVDGVVGLRPMPVSVDVDTIRVPMPRDHVRSTSSVSPTSLDDSVHWSKATRSMSLR